LPHIAVPSLVLSGRFDDQSPLDLSETLVRQLPNARLEVIDGGHGLLFNEDAAIDAVLSHFEEILT
ncbi:MAG: alpha/beta hydrolase, partial [Marivita sp.]|uniref:alpha/beta fold hydrolase n=1 Tax=Marivita sp. TaxID=2003365 RepID=UPI001B116102